MNGLHISGSEVYQRDIATLKKYREDYYKITLHKQIRRAGFEAIEGDSDRKRETGKKNTADNEEKLSASLSRTRATIYELALFSCFEHGYEDNVIMADNGISRKTLDRFQSSTDRNCSRALERISNYMNRNIVDLATKFWGASPMSVKITD